jgi:mannose-6-phosphate isomerase-like protein (cupin superfamily)
MRTGRAEDMPMRPITEFGSEGASISRVARGDDVTVVRIELRAGGRLAMHPASRSQLFMVVEGEGTVLADGTAPRRVSSGTSVWWQQGELHETRSELGLVAIVIEAGSLDPAFESTDADASAN